MVRPIVKYAVSVWDPHTLLNINKFKELLLDFVLMNFQDIQVLLTCYLLLIYHCYRQEKPKLNYVLFIK